MLEVRRLDSGAVNFSTALDQLLDRETAQDQAVDQSVAGIIAEIRSRGDAALLEFTARFDRREVNSVVDLEISAGQREAAWQALDEPLKNALTTAERRIRAYAERQQIGEFRYEDEHGNMLGQRVTPLDRVGIYVPGGKAAYPSSVLMNAIPAKVAGVAEIIMVAPAPDGVLSPIVQAAAYLAGVDKLYSIGGAQAVAALAYGTETIRAVDKIVGPGNAYVAAAKRRVFGQVGIDAIAGPSEIVIISDAHSDPDWLAMDLFSQAEHDEDAQAILLSPDSALLDAVAAAMKRRLQDLPRAQIVAASIKARGALIKTRDLDEAIAISNRIAPEHLELAIADPEASMSKVRHAGAIFLGRHTPEAFGDYCAGPNHVLPTSRAARYANPLGVYEFQKRSSLIACSETGARSLAEVAGTLADAEGLQAHAASARDRG